MPRITPERFASKGLRTGSPADALQPGQYPFLMNVRGNTRSEIVTRAGWQRKFTTENAPVLNISSYTNHTPSPTDPPRFLAAVNGKIYLDAGTVVDTGYGTVNPPSMLPFRPAQSPDPWMYIGDSVQYRKLSAPSPTDVVTAQNAGIAEPQSPPELAMAEALANLVFPAQAFTNSGAAAAVSVVSRTVDTIQAVFLDPNTILGLGTQTLQMSPGVQYQRDMVVHYTAPSGKQIYTRVNDVFQPLPSGISISGIEYYSGITGLCVVVPNLQAPGPGNEQSIFTELVMANLRRGALVQIGGEVCYVYDVETGPLGTISFTTSTQSNHTTADPLSGVPGIQLFYFATAADNAVPGLSLTSQAWHFQTGNGVGTVQFNVPQPSLFVFNGTTFEPDDILHFSVRCTQMTEIVEIKIILDVNNGPVDFVSNAYFGTVRQSDIQAGIANTLTQLGVAQLYEQRQQIMEESLGGLPLGRTVAGSIPQVPGENQWSEIYFKLSELTRIGNDQTRTLANMQSLQILVNLSGGNTSVVEFSSITVHGQRQMDTGQAGLPYRYRVRGRSSITGARSNPSPSTRYGWSPRRQEIYVFTPSPTDPQMDLWDIFRMGGSMDTFRLVGTIPVSTGSFVDNYSDIAVAEAEVLEFDNLQPWPTIDLPLNIPTGVNVNGTIVKFPSVSVGATQLANIPRYLPGNLVRLNETVYTLFNRPTVAGGTVTMSLVENADVATADSLFIYEPLMADQPLPYLWGPSAEGGTVFGCGDPNRPGTVYFSKNFNPDSAPDKYNLELSPPSEPLVGGLLHAGTSLVFSNVHWWELRPSFGGVNQWSARLLPIPAGCVSHFAACSDGRDVYFVGKDGIYSFSRGLITTRDNIYSLFPHEGVQGSSQTVLGDTIPAPEYEDVTQFRLCCANGFLYFDYIGV